MSLFFIINIGHGYTFKIDLLELGKQGMAECFRRQACAVRNKKSGSFHGCIRFGFG